MNQNYIDHIIAASPLPRLGSFVGENYNAMLLGTLIVGTIVESMPWYIFVRWYVTALVLGSSGGFYSISGTLLGGWGTASDTSSSLSLPLKCPVNAISSQEGEKLSPRIAF